MSGCEILTILTEVSGGMVVRETVPECEHCAANDRVKVALQQAAYRADKARIEAEDRARAAEAWVARIRGAVLKP